MVQMYLYLLLFLIHGNTCRIRCHTQILNSINLSKSLEYVTIIWKSNWIDIKKCPEISELVIFANIAILMMNFISFSIVKETVMLEKIFFLSEFNFEKEATRSII